MNCTNYCHQGRQPCPTPWTCGRYEFDAAEPQPVDQPLVTPEQARVWPLYAIGGALAAIAVGVALWLS